jgi:hypothetical protein
MLVRELYGKLILSEKKKNWKYFKQILGRAGVTTNDTRTISW